MSDFPDELPSDPAELRVFAAALLDRCARLERLSPPKGFWMLQRLNNDRINTLIVAPQIV
ncbi:hypothetical protein ACVWYH_010457 [Bradyrhizobium sp. GM24.11]